MKVGAKVISLVPFGVDRRNQPLKDSIFTVKIVMRFYLH